MRINLKKNRFLPPFWFQSNLKNNQGYFVSGGKYEQLVISEPYFNDTSIRKGDLIILHHNVFRRFRDIRGKEKNSRSFYEEDKYFVQPNQIFAFKNDQDWKACKGFNFVQPIKETKVISFKKGIWLNICKFNI